ncbi:predicted protein, partial [Scheffersomyces stipitis CBS 6054]
MINYDYSEQDILSFYNLQAVDPTSISHLNLNKEEDIAPEEINKLSKDEQFAILNRLVN